MSPVPSAAATAAKQQATLLKPNGQPPSALWLRLHRKVMEGPTAKSDKSAEEQALGRTSSETLGAPRGREPAAAASAALHGAPPQQLSNSNLCPEVRGAVLSGLWLRWCVAGLQQAVATA